MPSKTPSKTPGKDDRLKKILETLENVERGQRAICDRLERLEGGATTEAKGEGGEGAALAFLDQFRVGEMLGASSLGAWLEVCNDDALRGSLRVIEMRESFHARLLEDRIKALGGSAQAEIPQEQYEAAMESAGGT